MRHDNRVVALAKWNADSLAWTIVFRPYRASLWLRKNSYLGSSASNRPRKNQRNRVFAGIAQRDTK
jgi:hypothetical protein